MEWPDLPTPRGVSPQQVARREPGRRDGQTARGPSRGGGSPDERVSPSQGDGMVQPPELTPQTASARSRKVTMTPTPSVRTSGTARPATQDPPITHDSDDSSTTCMSGDEEPTPTPPVTAVTVRNRAAQDPIMHDSDDSSTTCMSGDEGPTPTPPVTAVKVRNRADPGLLSDSDEDVFASPSLPPRRTSQRLRSKLAQPRNVGRRTQPLKRAFVVEDIGF